MNAPLKRATSKQEFIDLINTSLIDNLRKPAKEPYEPTGLQEDIITTFGAGRYKVVCVLDANKVGKTRTMVEILKNVVWPCDDKWFAWWDGPSVFKQWPYKAKSGRITGTPTNLADSGPIQLEISARWPEGRYERDKMGKHFYSQIKCDTGWTFDVLTYEQGESEFEGPMLSLICSDEPPKAKFIGPLLSRMAEGGIWLLTMTPLNCGVFLDYLDEIEDRGTRVKRLVGSIYENSITHGKQNHLGTRRGLWTDTQIEEYAASIPVDERKARLFGEASNKEGKIYPMYDDEQHVIDLDEFPMTQGILKRCNCYMSIDPHPRHYPFIVWGAVRPDGVLVIYNEFPTFDILGCYYDEVRNEKDFNTTIEQLAMVIQSLDFEHYGANILKRSIDPRFASSNPEFIVQMAGAGVGKFTIPDAEKIEFQRRNLQSLLTYNTNIPRSAINTPRILVMEHCKNTRRALVRHHWEQDDKEADIFKDPIDAVRYLLSILGGIPRYIDNTTAKKDANYISTASVISQAVKMSETEC